MIQETNEDLNYILRHHSRPTWAQWALGIARAASERSEDPYVRVGACILGQDNSVASVGYNGIPAGYTIDMHDRDARRPYMVHAEGNALRYILPGQGRLIAVTHMPCAECLKMIKSYDINEVVYGVTIENSVYDLPQVQKMAFEFGVNMYAIGYPHPLLGNSETRTGF